MNKKRFKKILIKRKDSYTWSEIKISAYKYFRGRNFRQQKLLRDKKIAKFSRIFTKTFANSNFWDEFRVKSFRENQKTLHLEGKKLSGMATIFFLLFSFFVKQKFTNTKKSTNEAWSLTAPLPPIPSLFRHLLLRHHFLFLAFYHTTIPILWPWHHRVSINDDS